MNLIERCTIELDERYIFDCYSLPTEITPRQAYDTTIKFIHKIYSNDQNIRAILINKAHAAYNRRVYGFTVTAADSKLPQIEE